MADDTGVRATSTQVLRGPRYLAWMYIGLGILYLLMGVVFGWLGLTLGLQSSGLFWGLLAGIVFAVIGIVWLARALNARVELTDGTLTVYGYLVTRRIPRSSIVGFGSNGTVEWNRKGGGQNVTPIFVLGQMRPIQGSAGPFLKRFANDDFDRIAAWAAADHELTQNW